MHQKYPYITIENLLQNVSNYITEPKELERIEIAYQYAAEKHFGVKRLTGEDYIEHPLQVANILTGINADYETICAALLHDILEDCDTPKSELEEKFGLTIANLVDGVTKINKLNFDSTNKATIANHRKILVGLCEDVRVIIIKLADRLHNLRTLWGHTEEKQKEKAKETLEILTPIAGRLGMNHFKSELEDLSLRYLKPDIYFEIAEKLSQTKVERDNAVDKMMKKVSELLNQNKIPHQMKGRAKSIYSIYKKLEKGKKFNEIYDLLALRVFVNTEQECYQALGIIHAKYRPIPKRFKDYIAMPKTNMYQSLHTTVFGIDGYLFEVQIRTYEMDEIAERGIASHWSYKEKGSTVAVMQNTMEQKLQFFRSIMELNSEESNDEQFVKSVTEDIFKDTIYVYTPDGDVIELPAGATPIDFAYKVHTGVGDKMVGAIVNNNIVPLDYELHNQDIVKINTNKNALGPSREWLKMVKTTQAKNKIRAFYSKIDQEENLKKGEELLAKELRKRKLGFNEFLCNENVTKIVDECKCTSLNDVYKNIGSGKLAVGTLINIITEENNSKAEIILKKTQNKEVVLPTVKNDILVGNIDSMKVSVASCCKPVPGDRIVGYITKGYGITVHRMVCPNIQELEERIIDAKWNTEITKRYPTNLLIRTINNDSILLNIIAKTSNHNVSVESMNTIHNTNDTTYDVTVLVDGKETLVKFIQDVEQIPNVFEVKRLIK